MLSPQHQQAKDLLVLYFLSRQLKTYSESRTIDKTITKQQTLRAC